MDCHSATSSPMGLLLLTLLLLWSRSFLWLGLRWCRPLLVLGLGWRWFLAGRFLLRLLLALLLQPTALDLVPPDPFFGLMTFLEVAG